MNCRKCRKEIPDNSKYCNHCGAKQTIARQANRRADGSIQLSYRYIDDNGKQQRKYFYGQTRAEAERKKAMFLQQQQDEKDRAAGIVPQGVTVKEYAVKWCKQHTARLQDNTQYMYDNNVRKLKPIWDMQIGMVTRPMLQDIINDIAEKKEYSGSYWAKLSCTINQIFDMAEDDGLISKNPTRKLEYPDAEDGTHRCLEPWEIDLITDNWHIHRAGIWIMLMLYTGMRRGEVMALQWDAIDFDKGEVHITQAAKGKGNQAQIGKPKNKKSRTVPLPDVLAGALRAYKATAEPGQYVCLPAKGKPPASKSAFTRGWDGLLLALECAANNLPTRNTPGKKRPMPRDRAGYKRVIIQSHDLRHTYATMLFDAGVDVKTAQRYLGHAEIETTMKIYTHLSQERETASRESLLKYLEKKRQGVSADVNADAEGR